MCPCRTVYILFKRSIPLFIVPLRCLSLSHNVQIGATFRFNPLPKYSILSSANHYVLITYAYSCLLRILYIFLPLKNDTKARLTKTRQRYVLFFAGKFFFIFFRIQLRISFERLGAVAASTTVDAGYKRSISHCLCCGAIAVIAPNRQLNGTYGSL